MQLLKYRDFGEILGDLFTFLVSYWRQLLRLYLVFSVPVFIGGTILQYVSGQLLFREDTMDSEMTAIIFPLALGLFTMISLAFFFLATLSFIRWIHQLQTGETKDDWWSGTLSNMKQAAGPYAILVLLSMGIFALVGASAFLLFRGEAFFLLFILVLALIIPVIYLSVIYSMWQVVVVLRPELGVIGSWNKAFFLIRDYWWFTFGLIIVGGLIRTIMSYIVILPLMALWIGQMFMTSQGDLDSLNGINLFSLLTNVLSGLFYAILIIVLALQYFNLRERKEGKSLLQKIDSFGEEEDESPFSNEGEM